MADTNTDYLLFSAYSIKDLITRKLTDDGKFTDQIYEGSNLSILIDIFSYIALTLLYSLNNAAAESMFSDTLIYENINRLVKFIGYNPKGCETANVTITLDNTSLNKPDGGEYEDLIIPKYSFIDTEKTDIDGNKIYYSTAEEFRINSLKNYEFMMYNGKWHVYSTIFTSSGDEYLTFILSDLKSDYDNKQYIPNKMIEVYVYDGNEYQLYTMVDEGLFTDNNILNGILIYNSDKQIFNLRLNENKQYEITFGNGRNGKIPPKDSAIYIVYMKSNGPTGNINPSDIKNKRLQHSATSLGMTSTMYSLIFGSMPEFITDNHEKFSNISKSSIYAKEESVDAIRQNAPNWFKIGNRLVTLSDYEYYIKNRFRNNIVDCVCQNNWQYMASFYRWLYNLGVRNHSETIGKNYYINQSKLTKYDLRYADAADSNNVYLWIKMKNDSDIQKDIIDAELELIKTLTQEPVYLKPLDVYFSPCAEDLDTAREYFNTKTKLFDVDNNSYIELTVDNDIVHVNGDIITLVSNIIQDYFTMSKCKLGQIVDLNLLTNKILQIGSITRIRTVYENKETGKAKIIQGLAFASWTSDFIDLGDDLEITNTTKSLEPFQFPKLYCPSLISTKIKIIRKSINTINLIQY